MIKQFIIFIFIIVTFNACSVTNHYKINSDLEFVYVPEDQRDTYEYFGKEQFVKLVEKENLDAEDDFSDEFAEEEEPVDPLEGYNRVMTSFNDFLFTSLLDPVARGYAKVVPEEARVGISNFFDNITFPIRFVNNILQFKFEYAAEETGRFLINSTVGVLGFMDPATEKFNLKERDEDFGQTLAYYGVGEGLHIVLPVYGPSNVRDFAGSFVDAYLSPVNHSGHEDIKYKIPNRFEKTIGIRAFDTLNSTSLNLGQYQNLKKDAIDLYPFLRDIYSQNREKQIKE